MNAVASAAAVKDSAAAGTGKSVSSSAQCILLQQAVQDACAAVTLGGLNGRDGHRSTPLAAERRQAVQAGSQYLRQLFAEYEQATQQAVTETLQRPVPAGATSTDPANSKPPPSQQTRAAAAASSRPASAVALRTEPAVAMRAAASARFFAHHCGLTLKDPAQLRVPTTATGSTVNSASGDAADATRRVQPLVATLQQVRRIRQTPALNSVRSGSITSAQRKSSTGLDSNYYHLVALLQRLEDVLTRNVERLQHTYARCDGSVKLTKELGDWPTMPLRLLAETIETVPLDTVTEVTREKIRRMIFDVEELQHAQEQAVTDGDMKRSEELYFEQTSLLESMKPVFDALEAAMEKYKAENVDEPRAKLNKFEETFRTTWQAALASEESLRTSANKDVEKLKSKRAEVTAQRQTQKAEFADYTKEWLKLYNDNLQQQVACFNAMEELERRVKQLASDQAFLVEDRLQQIQAERQREVDGVTFFTFVEQCESALKHTSQNAEAAATATKEVGEAVLQGCDHLHAYLRDVRGANVSEALLQARQQRLEQFRRLYLTLGDLQFKKTRHAEEVEKKIEYYHLQQEIAMDTLNPKAKEFSQSKKKWEGVREEVKQQINVLGQRADTQLALFQPTERLLIEAGVDFVHPKQELEERNRQRMQKLLEYRLLMDRKESSAAGEGTAVAAAAAAASAGKAATLPTYPHEAAAPSASGAGGGGGGRGKGGKKGARPMASTTNMAAPPPPPLEAVEERASTSTAKRSTSGTSNGASRRARGRRGSNGEA